MSRTALALVAGALLLAGCTAAPAVVEPDVVASPSLPPGPDFPTERFTVPTPTPTPSTTELAEKMGGFTVLKRTTLDNGTEQLTYYPDDLAQKGWFFGAKLPTKKSDAELGTAIRKNPRRVGPSWCGEHDTLAGVYLCITKVKGAVVYVEGHDLTLEQTQRLSEQLAAPLTKD